MSPGVLQTSQSTNLSMSSTGVVGGTGMRKYGAQRGYHRVGSSRPGTPALSQQTMNAYGAAKSRASKTTKRAGVNKPRSNSRLKMPVRQGKRAQRSRKPLAPSLVGMGSDNSRGTSAPRLLNQMLNKDLSKKPEKKLASRGMHGRTRTQPARRARPKSGNIIKNRRYKKMGAGRATTGRRGKGRKSRPASAEPRTAVGATSRSQPQTKKVVRKNAFQASGSQKTLATGAGASTHSTIGNAASGIGASGPGTISSFIHRFRNQGPTSPEERRTAREESAGNEKFWWKKGAISSSSPAEKGGSVPAHATERGTRDASPLHQGGQQLQAGRRKSPARGSGLDAVATLRWKNSEVPSGQPANVPLSPEDDELDRRATELLQRCDAVLQNGSANKFASSKSVSSESAVGVAMGAAAAAQHEPVLKLQSPATTTTTTETPVSVASFPKSVAPATDSVSPSIPEQPFSQAQGGARDVGDAAPKKLLVRVAAPSATNATPSSAAGKPGAIFDRMLSSTVDSFLSGPASPEHLLFSGGMMRLITAPPPTKESNALQAGGSSSTSDDSVLAELERRVQRYEAALMLSGHKNI